MDGLGSVRTPVFRSLRLRMALSHGAVLAAIVLLLGGTGYLLLEHSQSTQATASLMAAAQDERDRVLESGVVSAPVDTDVPSAAATRLALFRPDGTAVGEASDVPPWLRPHPQTVTTVAVLGEPVRLVTLRAAKQGALLAVVVAGRSLAPDEALLERVQLLLLAGGLAAVALSMVTGWFLAGRAVRPVRRAYEAQAGFAADASHEFRTPLAFIRSAVELMVEREPDLGNEVLEEVDYLAALTDRLLTLARADSGTLPLRLRPLEVLPLCAEAASRNRAVHALKVDLGIEEDGASTAAAAEAPGPVALGDPVALEAALDALLENVARHGGGEATVSCRRVDGRVRVSVADHGPGLPPAQRARAFERFFRADPVRGRDEGGVGLGLALARDLLAAQRGSLWLEETPGGGLTAVMELPATDEPATHERPGSPRSPRFD